MLSNKDLYSKINLILSKIEEVKKPSSFDTLSVLSLYGKTESYLDLVQKNQVNLLNKEVVRLEIDELVMNCLNFKQHIIKIANRKLLQMEHRKETLSQIYDILLKIQKINNQNEYLVLFSKYMDTLELLFSSEDLSSLDQSKTKDLIFELKEKCANLNIDSKDSQIKENLNMVAVLASHYSQDISFLKDKIEELPLLIDEGDSSLLVLLRLVQKSIPVNI